ncbi:MAG: hypothetical protein HY870_20750 [Chloroflexi bacterium]|nr:hypothetical protein [Chloroflexota bacterium]
MQGRLRPDFTSISLTTECAHCGQPLHIEIDRDLNYRVAEAGARPIVAAPQVNFARLRDPSIIDAF